MAPQKMLNKTNRYIYIFICKPINIKCLIKKPRLKGIPDKLKKQIKETKHSNGKYL